MKKIILAIDIQNEYISSGRPYHIQKIDSSLAKARKVIDWGRQTGIPVWHMRHEHDKVNFQKGSNYAAFIPGFEPKETEFHFTKDLYSCFSSPEFTQKVAAEKPDEIIIIGYGSSMCCTCTIIDGIHRGYRFTLVEDATASRNFPYANEDEMHRSAIHILKQYANVVSASELMLN